MLARSARTKLKWALSAVALALFGAAPAEAQYWPQPAPIPYWPQQQPAQAPLQYWPVWPQVSQVQHWQHAAPAPCWPQQAAPQHWPQPAHVPSWPAPCPAPPRVVVPPPAPEPRPPQPEPRPPTPEPRPPQPEPVPPEPTPEAPDLPEDLQSAAAGGAAELFSPNMIGNLLRGYRGVQFSYVQAGDFSIANTSGAVNVRNTKVADNNSAIPRDRIGLRYNYFHNALDVAGLGRSPQLGRPITQAGGTPFRFNQVVPATRSYDAHLYTFQAEKTLLGDRFSIEARVPFATTLNSDLDLVAGTLLFPDRPDVVPLVPPSPERTLGNYDTEWQDMQVIFKALLWSNCKKTFVVSGGTGLSVPTGEDLNVRVVDYSNDVEGDPVRPDGSLAFQDFFVLPGNVVRDPNQFAFDQRTRQFRIENETYGLSPFLALAATPTERTFINAFTQVDIPLNRSRWTYRERDVDLEVQFDAQFAGQDPTQYDRVLAGELRDQTLLQLDIGGGYWVFLDPKARWLNGVAAILELHYTTTLEDADLVTVQANRLRTQTGTGGLTAPEPFPVLGNVRNNVDILDATVGNTLLLGNRATLATALSFPLKRESDRTYDWEFQLQFNFFFGGLGAGSPPPLTGD